MEFEVDNGRDDIKNHYAKCIKECDGNSFRSGYINAFKSWHKS